MNNQHTGPARGIFDVAKGYADVMGAKIRAVRVLPMARKLAMEGVDGSENYPTFVASEESLKADIERLDHKLTALTDVARRLGFTNLYDDIMLLRAEAEDDEEEEEEEEEAGE